MYKYIQGSAVSVGLPGAWNPVKLNELTFEQIFTNYTGALAEVEVVELKRRYTLDLWDLPTNIRYLPINFGEWLVSIGNATIPLQDDMPDTTRVYATYKDLWSYGFQVQGYNRNINVNQELTLDQTVDAIATKADVDYAALDKYALFVVNGLVHPSTYIPSGMVIQEAGRSLQACKENRIGVINFEAIGEIKRIPITTDMLIPATSDLPYDQAVYVKLDGLDTANKTIGVVLGGFLHLLDGAYDQVGSTLLKLNMNDYPIVERYWTLKQFGDASSIKLTAFKNRVDKLDFTELTSNENIAALLTHPLSFVFTIDAIGLGTALVMAHQAELAGRYVAYTKPIYPLISDTGRMINYTSYAAKHDYVVRTSYWLMNNYMRYTNEFRLQHYVTNHKDVHRPVEYQDAFWYQIFKAKETA